MAQITDSELKKQIKSKQFSAAYLLYGTEKLFVKRCSEMLVEAVAGKHPSDFNFHTFSGEINLDDFAAALQIVPFMSEYNCVYAYDVFFDLLDKDSIDRLKELIKNVPQGTVLIFSMPSYVPVKNAKAFESFAKEFNKIGDVCEFKKLNQSMLEKYIAKWANENGKRISHLNASKLISSCGEDLNTLKNEVDKISAYSSGEEITAEDIDLLASQTLEASIFNLSDAVLNGNGQRAFNILDILFYNKEEPVVILYTLSSSYIDAYRMRVADECAVQSSEVAKDFDYKNRAFALGKAKRATARVSTEALRQSLDALLEADESLKSTSLNARVTIEQLIARLLLTAREGRR